MNIRDNKGVNLISLTVTIIMLLAITGAMIYNTKNQVSMKKINSLKNDIETLKYKVDEYYLKYGELPTLCYFSNKSELIDIIDNNAREREASLNSKISGNDGDEYVVIDLEKLSGLTLNYGYKKDGDYFSVKQNNTVTSEDEIYIINTTTHQIYYPHGIVADNLLYFTF